MLPAVRTSAGRSACLDPAGERMTQRSGTQARRISQAPRARRAGVASPHALTAVERADAGR
jgi:hypothetical protein